MPTCGKAPIYAFSPYGLANRILGLASTMRLCAILNRPLILIWKRNADIGYVDFQSLYQNDLVVISQPPVDVYTVFGDKPLSIDGFPASVPTLLVCNDLCLFPGINKITIRPYLRSLRPIPAIEEQLFTFAENHRFANTVGIHLRKGDKWKHLRCKRSRMQIDDQYAKVILLIIFKSDLQIYLSCDDLSEQRKYRKLFGTRIIFSMPKENPLKRNSRSLPEAVTDLYLLSKAKAVLYGVGTFGYTSYVMGATKGGNLLCSKRDFFYEFTDLQGLFPNCLPDPATVVGGAIGR